MDYLQKLFRLNAGIPLILLLLCVLAGCKAPSSDRSFIEQDDTDTAYEKTLIGTWEPSSKNEVITYQPNGKSYAKVICTIAKPPTVEITAAWHVEDGILIEKIEISNHTLFPKGLTNRSKIVDIGNDYFTLTDGLTQKEITYNRIKNKE